MAESWNREEAIRARMVGDWENPHLQAVGPLRDLKTDLKYIRELDAEDVAFYTKNEIARLRRSGFRKVGEGWAKP